MELVIKHIGNLFNTINVAPWDAIQKIPQSGGDRVYFRIIQGEQSWIATYSLNIRESETFVYFADHFYEKGLEELLSKILINDTPPIFDYKINSQKASIYIITVGTPIIKSTNEPNLDYVINASVDIGKILKKGDLVILRSTVPVGTTRNIVLPILEKTSGLKINTDFDLAFCPKRTVEGKALTELKELPQIIGGFNERSI